MLFPYNSNQSVERLQDDIISGIRALLVSYSAFEPLPVVDGYIVVSMTLPGCTITVSIFSSEQAPRTPDERDDDGES